MAGELTDTETAAGSAATGSTAAGLRAAAGQPRLAGRVALVFGGGQSELDPADGTGGTGGTVVGIGYATATTFAGHGAATVVVDRDLDAARCTVDAVHAQGGRAVAVVADVTDPDQVDKAVARALDAYGRIDVVHNNVGVTLLGGPEDIGYQQWRDCLAVNLDSVFLTAQKTIPHLLARGGSIVNVSSTASIRWTGYPYPAYAAAKAGVNQLTRSLALQYADRGVRVNAVLAGLIDTPLVYRQLAGGRAAEEVRAGRAAASPTGTAGSAYDVANAALFLASDEAAYITGALVPVDGGLHARAA